jgi:hypothetical protein
MVRIQLLGAGAGAGRGDGGVADRGDVAGMNDELLALASWVPLLCPLILLTVLIPLSILVYRERRRRRREE